MELAAILFAASLAGLAYTFAGYPLLLLAWGRLAPRPVRKAAFEPAVAVVIPVHNGEAFIRRKIESALAQDYPAARLRVVVASDGSTDGTCAIVRALGDPRVKLLAFGERRGKAACVNDAVAACREECLVLTDVRQPLERDAVRRLLENLADPEVGAVSGSLVHESRGMSDLGRGLDAYWRYEQLLRALESRVHSMVGVLGALYAIRRECFRPIPPETILDDVRIPMQVVLQGRRVVFEERALVRDEAMIDAARERGRKVRTLAGNFQLLISFPALLAPWRDPIALQLYSHKVMRLLGPVFLVAAFVSNAVLLPAHPLFRATFALQVGGYALAAAGYVLPAAARLLPARLAMAFVSLNAFVVLGLVQYLGRRDLHLWKNPAAGPGRGGRRA